MEILHSPSSEAYMPGQTPEPNDVDTSSQTSPSTDPPSQVSEDDLVTRLRSGDPGALEQFYEAHVDGLYGFVYQRLAGERALVEDIVQETFLDALDHLENFDPSRGPMLVWLCVRSRNIMRKHLKVHRRSATLAQCAEPLDTSLAQSFRALDSAPLSDEVIEREETRALVHATIEHLPDRYQTLLTRKYMRDESLATLAADFEISEQAAKSLLARARRAFRQTFVTLSDALTGGAS